MSSAIRKTLNFFDLFEMPLTAAEIWQCLPGEISYDQVVQDLETLSCQNKEAFYFLDQADPSIVALRKSRQARAMQWLDQAKPWLTCLASFPGVEMIAVCNNLAWFNVDQTSDIDLFIITKPGMIWQTRFVLTAFLQLFKKRTSIEHQAEDSQKFCLSFFTTSDNLDLRSVAIENDIYLAHWLKSLLPVYDPHNLINKIWEVNWPLFKEVSRAKPQPFIPQWQVNPNNLYRLLAAQLTWFPTALERRTKAWQIKRFPRVIKEMAKDNPKAVVISDKMLKFHTNDRRAHYRDEWLKKYA